MGPLGSVAAVAVIAIAVGPVAAGTLAQVIVLGVGGVVSGGASVVADSATDGAVSFSNGDPSRAVTVKVYSVDGSRPVAVCVALVCQLVVVQPVGAGVVVHANW